MFHRLTVCIIGLFALVLMTAHPVWAQSQTLPKDLPGSKQVRFPCGAGLVQNNFNLLHRAAFQLADVPKGHLRVNFIGHASFLVESPQGVKVVFDYNDYYRADVVPDIATMNIQRGNHSAYDIQPGIKYLLQGWSDDGKIARHDVTFKDVRVYNLPTNILNGGNTYYSNFSSMFIVQSSGVCVAHMGHLRHMLEKEQFARIGQIDVLMIPIDRRVTQSFEELLHNLKGIRPRIIVPMHFNSLYTVDDFLSQISSHYPVKRLKGDTIEVSKINLPKKTEVWQLTPKELQDTGGSKL